MKRKFRGTVLGLALISVLTLSVSVKASVDNGVGRLNFQQFKIYGSKQTLMATGYTQYSPYGTINVKGNSSDDALIIGSVRNFNKI